MVALRVAGASRDRRGRRRARVAPIALLAALAFAAGCSSGTSDTAPDDDPSTTGSASGTIVVSAAASLTDAFTDIAAEFTEEHPAADITFNFGSSGSLAAQVDDGAPADVIALADTVPMDELDDAGHLATTPSVFARNELVVVTPPGNPGRIDDLADLGTAGIVSLCVETAPCGSYAAQVLAAAGVTIPVTSISRGTDARATLRAVVEGDAAAAIVYATDARAAGDRVDTVDLNVAEQDRPIADYPIAVVDGASNPELAQAFTTYVLSAAGRAVLEEEGFLAP